MLSPEQSRTVSALLAAARAQDGVDALSENFLRGLRDERLGHRHLLREGGIAALDGNQVELCVHPEARGRGVGRSLITEARSLEPDAEFWAHGNLPAARHLAAEFGMRIVRELLVMELDGEGLVEQSQLSVPEGYEALSLSASQERWGQDLVLDAWLAVNNEAFDWHPEQGGWDRERLARACEAEWFDPQDVLFLWDTTGPAPALAGFHWTKWHTEEKGLGEIYVIGLARAFQGRGLGTPLLRMGVRRLAQGRGATRVILYVEADNEAATSLYARRGFTEVERHTVYR